MPITVEPLAVVDIGSNSVRLVVYERLARSPTPLFNEKVLCGLASVVAAEGRITEAAAQRVLATLARYRLLADNMGVGELFVLATAAVREAKNGAEFLARAEAVMGRPAHLLSGAEEAELSAYGVICGIHEPRGVVGDLGGGSLELTTVEGEEVGDGVTLPLGGLVLRAAAHGSLAEAAAMVRAALKDAAPLAGMRGRAFYAVGGTWRALAHLHMEEGGYPLRVMHGYRLPGAEALAFAKYLAGLAPAVLAARTGVSAGRRPLVAYGALVLGEIVRRMAPGEVVMSALGVREGHLYRLLDAATRRTDPLLAAAAEIGVLRARSALHGPELVAWSDRLFEMLSPDETDGERRLRHAACHLADIGWRAHPDYRGEQSFDLIANAAFVGVDHPGRAFLALAIYFRHEGAGADRAPAPLAEIAGPRLVQQARLLGAAFRVAFLLSGGMPGVLPRVPLVAERRRLVLGVPARLSALPSERVAGRLKQLARLAGRDAAVEIEGKVSAAS
jgi:exopolyphosphatase/guanosine-5'-triphosphate,3'-diphosphate pyrophosphatase